MAASNDSVIAAAKASPLMHYDWPHRGVAPAGYTKGMAVAFAETYRLLKSNYPAAVTAARPLAGDARHDVLDHYAPELAAVGASAKTPAGRLISVFAIMLGLGMRESSGRHCCGPDTPEDRGPRGKPVPTTEQNAEAGLFQVSYDSVAGDADRQKIIDDYAGHQDLLTEFGEGAHCSKPKHWPPEIGTGAAREFQAQMKECPLFAVLYTAMFLRQARGHWGPITRKEAEVRTDAVALYTKVKAIVDREETAGTTATLNVEVSEEPAERLPTKPSPIG